MPEVLEAMPEVMRCVPLCILEAVEGGLCLLVEVLLCISRYLTIVPQGSLGEPLTGGWRHLYYIIYNTPKLLCWACGICLVLTGILDRFDRGTNRCGNVA